MTTKRLVWIDIVRGIAIIAVISFHTGFLPLQHQILPLVTPWMLPIFAVAHGILIPYQRKSSTWEALLRRGKTFLGAYVGYGFVTFAAWLVLIELMPGTVIDSPWQLEVSHFLTGTSLVFNGPLWFLPSFFLASVLVAISKRSISQASPLVMITTSLVLVFVAIWLNPTHSQFPFSYDLSILFFGFMLFGRAVPIARLPSMSRYFWFVTILFFVFISWTNGTVDIFERMYKNPSLFWLSGILGTLVMIRLAMLIETQGGFVKEILVILGKRSMLLLSTHWPIMQWLTFVLARVGILSLLGAVPTYTSFSYFVENKYIFTAIEVPLLIAYVVVSLLPGTIGRRARSV